MRKSYEFAVNLLKQYKWNSIMAKYWKKLLLVFLIPFIIINSIVYLQYSRILQEEFQATFSSACAKVNYDLENIFSEIQSQYVQLVSSSNVNFFINISRDHLFHQTAITQTKAIKDSLSAFQISREHISGVYVYSLSSDYVITANGGVDVGSLPYRQWFRHYSETGLTNFVIPVYASDTDTISHIAVCYGIRIKDELKGLVVFHVSAKELRKIISQDLIYNLEALYLIDNENNVIFSTSPEAENTISENHVIWPALQLQSPESEPLISLKEQMYLRTSLFSDKLTLVFHAKSDYIGQKTSSIHQTFLLLILVATLIPVLMSLYLSLQFYIAIHRILTSLNADCSDENINEIEFIIKNILALNKSSTHFEQTLAHSIQQLKQAQSLALQAQFNPHFLFNTLNIINMMVANETEEESDACKAIVLFSDLLYSSVHSNDYIVTLNEELTHAEKYIEIMQMQYKDRFLLKQDFPTDTLSCRVLRLMLQPILENAFLYGMKSMPHGKTFILEMSSHIREDHLFINIRNNGNGVSGEKLQELQNIFAQDDILQSRHIGLNNIHQRIRLLYGDDFGLRLHSTPDSFLVTIVLPVNR